MATAQELQLKIAEAARLKREAEEREEARLRAEREAQEEIARREAEIAALQAELREAAFAEAQPANAQLVAANAEHASALTSALDLVAQKLLSAAQHEMPAVERSHIEQDRFVLQTVNNVVAGVDFTRPDDRSEHDAAVRAQGEIARCERAMDVSLPPFVVIMDWIAKSDSPQQRQIRQGIGYALTGQIFNPADNYTPKAAVRQMQVQRRNVRF